jgi:hypothetical protein
MNPTPTGRRRPRAARRRALGIASLILLSLLASAALVELGGRVLSLLYPAYDVVFLQPDRVVGWKQVPDLTYRWTGSHLYAADFSVEIRTNSSGFRDRERSLPKAPDTLRIGLLGDSMVEALQVPFEQTAGALLEGTLREARRAAGGGEVEVLNFAISSFSLGQYLLVWEEIARAFRPDYVVAFVSGIQMARTVRSAEPGAFPATAHRSLDVRPTFGLGRNGLVRRPAKDYEAFVSAQREVIDGSFGGRRMRKRGGSLLLWVVGRLRELASRPSAVAGPIPARPRWVVGEPVLRVNLAVLEELARQTRASGARLVLVDASTYFVPGAEKQQRRLERLCDELGLGYIPLARDLNEANAEGVATRWRYDVHFNEAGNRIFAEAMVRWLTEDDPTLYEKSSAKISSLKPTTTVLPVRSVGARRFPVGPSIASTHAFGALPPGEKVSTFLPLATTTLLAPFARLAASLRPSLREAGTTSRASMPLASRNLDARVQDVQPLRW